MNREPYWDYMGRRLREEGLSRAVREESKYVRDNYDKYSSHFRTITQELEEYIKGGADNEHKQLREGYGHIPKPQARKIMKYLNGILEDAVRYSHDRRPGRRKKDSK